MECLQEPMLKKMFFASLTLALLCLTFLSSSSHNNRLNMTHVIFDFDGTLVDTDSCYVKAIDEVTSKFGKRFTWNDSEALQIRDLRGDANSIIDAFKLPLSADQFATMATENFEKCRQHLELQPGAEKLIKYFHFINVPMAICTSSSSKAFKYKTEQFKSFFEVGKYFEVIVTAKDDPTIANDKPSPEPYLATIQRFRKVPDPSQVLVFEDSPEGVLSAVNAGAFCVAINNPKVELNGLPQSPNLLAVIDNLEKFDPLKYGFRNSGEYHA